MPAAGPARNTLVVSAAVDTASAIGTGASVRRAIDYISVAVAGRELRLILYVGLAFRCRELPSFRWTLRGRTDTTLSCT